MFAWREDTVPPSILLEIIWLDNSNDEIVSPISDISNTGVTSSTDTNITSTLTFPYTRTSQAGRYTCAVNMTIPNVVDDHLVMKTANVYVRSKFFLFFLNVETFVLCNIIIIIKCCFRRRESHFRVGFKYLERSIVLKWKYIYSCSIVHYFCVPQNGNVYIRYICIPKKFQSTIRTLIYVIW